MHQKKIVSIRLKAAGTSEDGKVGKFTGYASVFGNVDSYGDRVVKGAFEETLTEWAEKTEKSGLVIPLLYGHDMQDPNNNIGHVKAEEDDHGLKVEGEIDLEGGNGPQVYRLIKGGRLGQMSFAYDIIEGKKIDADSDEQISSNHLLDLLKLKLYEVSLVPIGANQETELLEVKSVISRFDAAQLKNLGDLLEAFAAGKIKLEAGKASAVPAKSDEEPRGAKSDEEPNQTSADQVLLSIIDGL